MDNSVNLIPPAMTRRFRHKRNKSAWIRMTVAGALASAITITCGRLTVADQRAQVLAEKADASRPRQVQRQNQSLHKQLADLDRYLMQQQQLRSAYDPLALFSMLSEIKQELDGKLKIESVSFQLQQLQVADDSGTSERNGTVDLDVIVQDTTKSAKLLQRFRETGFFREVHLSGAMEKVSPESSDLRFTIRCEF